MDSENEESPDVRHEDPQPLEFVLGKTEQEFKTTNMTNFASTAGLKINVHSHLIKVKNLRL